MYDQVLITFNTFGVVPGYGLNTSKDSQALQAFWIVSFLSVFDGFW